MKLNELTPVSGSRKRSRKAGRGIASGQGKTSGRGHRGQKQRSGYSKRFGFEGGQTPLYRRLPKIHNFDGTHLSRAWVEINVGCLNHLEPGFQVTGGSLYEAGLIAAPTDSLRVLGNGQLKVALIVKARHVSGGARAKIEAAGGQVEILQPALGKKAGKYAGAKVPGKGRKAK